ncbi:hypothetical protein, partial [Actinomadura sp. CNU-125]|uniref:hypothetical protein n=1 Tax=Actinomadura sp. CNU-125 TaxID=1904961 RepID=UPI0021CD0362
MRVRGGGAVDQLQPGRQGALRPDGVAALQVPLREVVRGGRPVLGVAGGQHRLPVAAGGVEVARVVGEPGEREMRGRQVGGVAEVDDDAPGGRGEFVFGRPLVGERQVVGGARAVLGVAGGDGGAVGVPRAVGVLGVVEDDREPERGLRPVRGVAEGEHPLEQARGAPPDSPRSARRTQRRERIVTAKDALLGGVLPARTAT